jgi:hypothetical protein
MNAKHEKENVKETDALERGQKSPPPHYEKGASDQNFQISQVGHTGNDRKNREAAPVHEPSRRSGWFDDPTKEIGAPSSDSQFEIGWVYRRTEIGHRRERTKHRGRVS